ncbi:MAG: thioredoxin [Chromatiales bacterium]|jgi:putative thioredoxin
MAESPHIIEITQDNFQEIVLQGSIKQPVLVDFWAEWCAPCRSLMPLLAKLAEEYRGKFLLAKLNTEEQRELATRFGIRSLPTVKLFRNGEPVDEFMGALPETEIRAFLERHIPREADLLLNQVDALLLKGDAAQAGQLLEQANRMEPDYPRVRISYARYKATLGELADAERLLMELPLDEQMKPEVVSMLARIHFDRTAQESPPVDELQLTLDKDPGNSEALYQLASHRIMEQDYAGALELLLALMQKDRGYGDDAGRKGMLQVFEMLGNEGELVKRYRSRMFNILH